MFSSSSSVVSSVLCSDLQKQKNRSFIFPCILHTATYVFEKHTHALSRKYRGYAISMRFPISLYTFIHDIYIFYFLFLFSDFYFLCFPHLHAFRFFNTHIKKILIFVPHTSNLCYLTVTHYRGMEYVQTKNIKLVYSQSHTHNTVFFFFFVSLFV